MLTPKTAQDFDDLAKDLLEVSRIARSVAKSMRDQDVSQVMINGVGPFNHHAPALLAWAHKASAEIQLQLRAHRNGNGDVEDHTDSQRDAAR